MQTYAVMGNPISHSLSPIIHSALFEHFHINAKYEKILLSDFEQFLPTFLRLNGANITLPYKQNAFAICDEVRGEAVEIGAVNTIVWENQKIIGYNTDVLGFLKCIEGMEFENALILGAGGSAKAVAYALKSRKIPASVYNRNAERLEAFAQEGFEVIHQCQTLQNQSFDLVVNATSAGVDGSSLPLAEAILSPLLENSKMNIDLMYANSSQIQTLRDLRGFLSQRPKTAFCALDQKCHSIDGLDMLVYQAIFAFLIFTRRDEDFEAMEAIFYGGNDED
ncbi:hypothetical protein BBW65_03805 [Helicobacter enhydrae]|uniref:Shikimate dehydrogenase (NADP(+)) n=2 Tax=Helicobacter enhydrae TaxID=222136 RepID=A0A1B1U5K6_9HELI|nr:hypothetical protein BBW65_03805 [Helicobacter enhydrae]